MQWITIGVARTRDMRGLDVRVQLRGVDGTPGTRNVYVRSLRYEEPISLSTEQGLALAEEVANSIRSALAQPKLPF